MQKRVKKVAEIIVVAIISVVLFAVLAYLSRNFLLPRLPEEWQTDLVWWGSTIVATIAILAGLSEFTGYNLKELFTSPKVPFQTHQQKSNQGAIVLNADTHGKIDLTGDIIQGGGIKVVTEQAGILESQQLKETQVEKLIRDIQSVLYGDDSQLPYALTLCLELCTHIDLPEKYGEWLRCELEGYEYERFRSQFDDESQFESWKQEWASHRLIEAYIKGVFSSQERTRAEITDLPVEKIFVAVSVSQVIRKIQDARNNGYQELSLLMRSLGRDHFDRLQAFVHELSSDIDVPPDLRVFYRVSALEQVLDGVRTKVLSLLSDARQQIVKV